MKNKKIIVKVFNVLFFFIVAFVTFYIIFKRNNISFMLKKLSSINIVYVLLAILFMFIYISCEGINIRRVLITLGDKVSIIRSFKYAVVGFFFSAVTPSASGGDPAQLYFMSKDNLSISHSTLALLVELSSFQLVSGILTFVGLIFNREVIMNDVGNLKYFVFIGMLVNIVFLIFLLVMIFSKKLGEKLFNFIFKVLEFFHYKKIDKFKEKSIKQIEEYNFCAMYLKKNKKVLVKIVLTTFVEFLIYYSIPYLIYLSFGLSKYSVFKFITLGAVLYTSVGFLPLPGAMGASEGGFVVLFKMLFPEMILSSAMIISRGISYYLFVLLCGLFIIAFMIKEKFSKGKNSI